MKSVNVDGKPLNIKKLNQSWGEIIDRTLNLKHFPSNRSEKPETTQPGLHTSAGNDTLNARSIFPTGCSRVSPDREKASATRISAECVKCKKKCRIKCILCTEGNHWVHFKCVG